MKATEKDTNHQQVQRVRNYLKALFNSNHKKAISPNGIYSCREFCGEALSFLPRQKYNIMEVSNFVLRAFLIFGFDLEAFNCIFQSVNRAGSGVISDLKVAKDHP